MRGNRIAPGRIGHALNRKEPRFTEWDCNPFAEWINRMFPIFNNAAWLNPNAIRLVYPLIKRAIPENNKTIERTAFNDRIWANVA